MHDRFIAKQKIIKVLLLLLNKHNGGGGNDDEDEEEDDDDDDGDSLISALKSVGHWGEGGSPRVTPSEEG